MRKLVAFATQLAGVGALALVGGCAEPPADQEPSIAEVVSALTLPPPPPGATCVTIQRGGAGNVLDADLSPSNGNWPAGGYPALWTGGGSLYHWGLAKPDLSPIPPGSQILSSTFSVYVSWNEASSQVRAHRVTGDWAESTVTWPSFGGAASWDPQTLGSFDASGVGYKSVDVTALTQGWYSGAVPNHGVLLEENPDALHSFRSSESGTQAARPRFDVCYLPGPCAGKHDGDACDDGDACTQTDTCQAGACTGASPVTCAASDQCHDAGTCDPATGACSDPAKADGAACSDGDACTQTDTCQAGACNGANEVACNSGICQPSTGTCVAHCPCRGLADWHPLNQESSCSYSAAGSGTNGVHLLGDGIEIYADAPDGSPGTCSTPGGSFSNPSADDFAACLADLLEFDATAGAGAPALLCACQTQGDGAACNDGDACTQGDTCQSGACAAGTPVTCGAGLECNAQSGQCVPDDPCAPNPCENGGTCTSDEGIHACACPPGFDGPECQIPPDPCQPDPCNGNGLCAATDPYTYTCACLPGWSGASCDVPSCPCSVLDASWSGALGNPGIEVIPASLQNLYNTCNGSSDTADFSGYRAFLPGVDATVLADFQTAVAGLDTSDPGWCVAAHDLYVGLVELNGFVSAGTLTSTSNGVTTTATYCTGGSSFYVTSAAQNAICVGELDAAGGGSVTTM